MNVKTSPPVSPSKKWPIYLGLIGFLVVLTMMARTLMPPKTYRVIDNYQPWAQEVIETVKVIPLQDGGRIKPLEVYANYTLLKLYGAQTIKIEKEGENIKINATQWLLDVLFRPEISDEIPSFRVDNGELLESLGLEVEQLRDRYSFSEIKSVQSKLFELAQVYQANQGDEKLPLLEKQTVALARSVESYIILKNYFNFAREPFELIIPNADGKEVMQEYPLSSILTSMPQIHQTILDYSAENPNELPPHIEPLLNQMTQHANDAKFELMLFAPAGGDKVWLPAGDIIWSIAQLQDENWADKIIQVVAAEQLYESIANLGNQTWLEQQPVALNPSNPTPEEAQLLDSWEKQESSLKLVKDWNAQQYQLMNEVSSTQADRMLLEHTFTDQNFIYKALVLFILAFVLTIFSWLTPASLVGKVLRYSQTLLVTIALILSTIAIVQRCMIMERPPVGNLYDTIPFITVCAVLFCLLLELLFKKMKPNSYFYGLSALIGLLGLFLARRYEFYTAQDPMDPLIAVLRSNYWLSTHVITITLGYSAGLLTSALSHGFIALKLFKLDADKSLERLLTRMVYGCCCFTLLLSLIGTVLGGIWANDSWGRFWGWDPKENGALMIVLWSLIMLHARIGGYIKVWGIHILSIIGGCVIAFSWWHVNFLGIGLHSYGFTDGEATLWYFYAVELAVVIIGLLVMWSQSKPKQTKSVAE